MLPSDQTQSTPANGGTQSAPPQARRAAAPKRAAKTYKIGQIAALLGLKPFVLRFWETEFPMLQPVRTPKGQRLYTEEHLRLLKNIQRLMHTEGMTLEGARRKLAERQRKNELRTLVERELREIRALLAPEEEV
ncbi:MerR family transcriptional regulator [Fundidesulfovibrio agrisoli]|uniref:MerR family transcriptional regulator n=1 Tax=Fundidesulfovibrio agrisoli TaxID=2922717 RepID=UPI00311A9F41